MYSSREIVFMALEEGDFINKTKTLNHKGADGSILLHN